MEGLWSGVVAAITQLGIAACEIGTIAAVYRTSPTSGFATETRVERREREGKRKGS